MFERFKNICSNGVSCRLNGGEFVRSTPFGPLRVDTGEVPSSTRTRLALAGAAAAALAVTITTVPGADATAHRQQAHQRAIALDTTSRSAVAAAWRAHWVPASRTAVALSGGSVGDCTPFRAAASAQARTLAALNFARGLVGVDPLTSVTDSRLAGAARSALIQAANDTLNHYPSRGMKCYSKAGAKAAGRSNLGYLADTRSGWTPTVTQFVVRYLSDTGATNAQVFHRRWVLRPQTTTMANAYAMAQHGIWHVVTNDLYVFPSGTDDAHATRPKFVAWPSAGYFPTQLEPKGRWSLGSARAGISLKHAKIKVTHNGRRVRITKKPFQQAFNGDRTVVFQLAHAPAKVTGAGVSVYKVTITHIEGAGKHTYKVRLFRP